MINSLFSCMLAASILAQTDVTEIPTTQHKQASQSYVPAASGIQPLQVSQAGPGKSKKYKKKMSKQMKKRKRH